MKIAIVILLLCTGFWFCNVKNEQQETKAGTIASLSGAINFHEEVEPIFQKNCMPCHFPGGKMYERMPFDEDTTILRHATGILRRIKKKDEIAVIEKFVKGNE